MRQAHEFSPSDAGAVKKIKKNQNDWTQLPKSGTNCAWCSFCKEAERVTSDKKKSEYHFSSNFVILLYLFVLQSSSINRRKP